MTTAMWQTNAPLSRFLFGAACGCAAGALRVALMGVMQHTYVFVAVYFAVVIVSWFRGFYAGIGALTTGVLICQYWVAEPSGQLMPPDSAGWTALIIVVLISCCNAVLSEKKLRAIEHLEAEVTRRKLLESELEFRVVERTRALQEATAELEAFCYTIAHDFRTPLRAIAGYSRILATDPESTLTRDQMELLNRSISSSKRLAQMMDDLLDYAKISRQDILSKPFNMAEIASNVARDVQDAMGAPVKIQVAENLPAVGDPMLVRTALINLLDNAIKYSPNGGVIEVSSMETSKGQAFYVRDQGIGFEMQYVDRIFSPFERLVGTFEYPGTGIGLANVKRIINRHGGEIWAESEVGSGSTFYFTLGKASAL